MQPEKMQERMKRYEGLVGPERTHEFILDLWKWAGEERKVYWVAEERRVKTFEGLLPWEWPDRFKTVATIQLPKAEAPEGPEGAGPGFMGPPDGAPGDRPTPRMMDRMRMRGPGGGPMGFGSLLSAEKLVLVEWTTR
jgi:hypothetical protein